ncbi:MAG: hypothetical protein JST36_03800 [Bacteroidetes bacterium]|nr:hypothetical protein [Bacteroidota bacterium]
MRQRLADGEERERPGAWLAMRELLDKEMPKAAAGYNWRRFFGYLGVLLLLSSASIGGYMYLRQPTQPIAAVALGQEATNAPTTVSNPTSSRSKSLNSPALQANQPNPIAESAKNTPFMQPESIPAATSTTTTSSSASSAQQFITKSNKRNRFVPTAIKNNSYATPTSSSLNAGNSGSSNNANTSSANQEIIASAQEPNTANQKEGLLINKNIQPSAAKNKHNQATSLIGTLQSNRSEAPANTNQVPVVAASGSAGIGQGIKGKFVYDTIARLRINSRRELDASTRSVNYKVDTVPLSQMVVARFVPHTATTTTVGNSAQTKQDLAPISLAKQKNATTANKTFAAAKVQVASKEEQRISPQANTENATDANLAHVKTNKGSGFQMKLWDAEKMQERLDKIKYDLSSIQIFPGIMMGINGSFFTPNSLGGFQVGLTSLVAINEWWSLLTELKYLYQFNTGSTVRDDYSNVTEGSVTLSELRGVPYDYYSWKQEHVDHYFNYEVIQSFQLPIALRYCWGRFFAQAGLNLVYSTPIKATEVTNFRNDAQVHTEYRPISPVKSPFVTDDHPIVKMEDFGSRFGTGYVLGAGFNFTPNVYFDLRATQTFWDNAKTQGAKQISKDLFKTPSIQLSVGYRLSGKDK